MGIIYTTETTLVGTISTYEMIDEPPSLPTKRNALFPVAIDVMATKSSSSICFLQEEHRNEITVVNIPPPLMTPSISDDYQQYQIVQ